MAGLLSELALTLLAIEAILLIFALQGFVSAFREGPELHVGRIYPRLTRWRSTTLLIGTLVLVVSAIVLGGGIALGWGMKVIGSLAGLGALLLGFMLHPLQRWARR